MEEVSHETCNPTQCKQYPTSTLSVNKGSAVLRQLKMLQALTAEVSPWTTELKVELYLKRINHNKIGKIYIPLVKKSQNNLYITKCHNEYILRMSQWVILRKPLKSIEMTFPRLVQFDNCVSSKLVLFVG